jgi:hypothetical protein
MTNQMFFRIWVIEVYLEFGAWDLVLPYGYALCSMLHALCLYMISAMSAFCVCILFSA